METALHVALVVLVCAWTLVSLVLGVAVVMLLKKIDRVLEQMRSLLAEGQGLANDVRAPVQAVAESVREVFATPSVPPARPLPST